VTGSPLCPECGWPRPRKDDGSHAACNCVELGLRDREFRDLRVEDCRPEVQAFAIVMEQKLRKFDHRGGWIELETPWLRARANEELAELDEALRGESPVAVLDECADVSNFLMMLADKAVGGLRKRLQGTTID